MNNIFLFHGADSYSSNEKLKFWQKQFIEKHGEHAIESVEAKNLIPGEFLTNAASLPFLAEKKMMVVKDFLNQGKAEDQKKIADNLSKIPDFCILIFHEEKQADKRTSLYKKLLKEAKVEDFPLLDPQKIAKWILNRQKNISQSTANFLGEYCGSDLWKISHELTKLDTYCQSKEIQKEDIGKLVSPSLSASIFLLTDTLAQKKQKEALKSFHQLTESGEDPIRIFFMIVRHFRILIQVKSLVKQHPETFISKRIKQHPYVIKKSVQQLRNFSSEKLKIIYQQMVDIDRNFKTGLIKISSNDTKEYALAIEKFIIDCCTRD